jgi:hypothetical protein
VEARLDTKLKGLEAHINNIDTKLSAILDKMETKAKKTDDNKDMYDNHL